MKTCTGCKKEKPLTEFYDHPEMSDGKLNPCKSCRRKAARDRYADPVAYKRITAYERRRWLDPKRRAKALRYQRIRRRRNPGKYRARNRVNNALRDGRLQKQSCWCGDLNTQAHHTDYRRPLVVIWLCRKHHLELEGKQHWN